MRLFPLTQNHQVTTDLHGQHGVRARVIWRFLLVKLLIFKYLNKLKAIVKIEQEVEIKTLEVVAQVRYWEDAEINGEST